MRVLTLVMFLAFLAAAALQYNDPDPYVWIPVYLSAAFFCGVYLLKKKIPRIALKIAIGGYLFGAMYVGAFQADWRVGFRDEAFREMLGLLITAAWSFFLITNERVRAISKQ